LIFAIALLFVAGSTGVMFRILDTRAAMLYGVVDPLTAESLPFRTGRFGVNAELTAFDDEAALQTQLELMQDAQITWVRQYIYWDRIEASPGRFDWSEYDPIIDAVEATGNLRLVAVLMNTPGWARPANAAPDDPTAPPEFPASFARFAGEFARRYGDRIDTVQVWDEPNLFTNWGRLPPRAAEYTALLSDAYHAIHAADPHVTVIAAALAPTIETGPDNVSDLIFLRDMYAFGASDVMDAVAGKPYGFDFSHDDRRADDRLLNFSRFAALREVMIAHGDADKPLWGSHWGWNSLPSDWKGSPSIWGEVSAQEQVDYTLGAIERAEREWPWLGGLILHHWNPPYPSDHPQQGFALTTPESKPTALLQALVNRAAPQHASTGWHPVRHPDAEYSGVWTFSEAGADIGWLRDSRVRFTFTGTDVGLLLREDNYVAHLYVTVDGQPANALPRDGSGNAYIVLSSGSREPQTGPVAVARDLPYGLHTVEIIADQGFDRYALAGFTVGSGDIARTYNAWAAGASLAFMVSVLAAAASGATLPWRAWSRRASRLFTALSLPLQIAVSFLTSLALLATFLLSLGQPDASLIRREPVLPIIAFLSAGAVYLNVALPLTLAAGLILFWCITQRISIGLMLTIFYAPFFLFPVELYLFRFPMVEILTLMTSGAWVLHQFADWGRLRQIGATVYPLQRLRLSWPDRLVIAYLILGFAALFWSEYRGFALTELRVLFIEPVLFYLVLRTSRLSEIEWRGLALSLLAAGTAVACISLLQYVRGEAIITAEDASRRLAGVYGSPNNLALFLGRCLPFAFAAVLVATSKTTRLVATVMGLLMLAAIVLTQSVGGIFVGLPAALAVVLLLAYGRRALPYLVLVAVIAAIGFGIAASQSDRFARALDFSQGTNFYRVRVMQSAVQIIANRPLTGLGLDQFLYAFRDTYIYPDAWPEPDLSHPHNLLLDFWVRLGIGGALLAVGFVATGIDLSIRSIRASRNTPFWYWMALGTAGAFADTIAHGLLDNSIFVIDLIFVFFTLYGLAQAVVNFHTSREDA
jgi:O-antigen ligase